MNDSISGTSPPPFGVHHGHGRPHAIVIPGSRMGSLSGMAHAGTPSSTSSNGGRGNGWYMPGQSQSLYVSFFSFSLCFKKLMDDNKTSVYSLSTPGAHAHPQDYTLRTFSSQDVHRHLPPLQHAHSHSHGRSHSHSLPKGLDTSCHLDGVPSLWSVTPSKSSSASPAPNAVPCFSSFCSTPGRTRGQKVPQRLGQQPVSDKQTMLANEKLRGRGFAFGGGRAFGVDHGVGGFPDLTRLSFSLALDPHLFPPPLFGLDYFPCSPPPPQN